jgi:hypothetical protein
LSPLPFAYARKLKINVANVAKRENYTLADTAEASRIARELVKLHRDGAIKTAGDASFYANLVRDFSATYAKNDRNHPDHPPMDRVPQPPRGISPQERIKFYQADLADPFGEEFIDRDYQPPSPARRLKPKEKARGKG